MKDTNFRPYEGQEPYIFISYAHKNSDRVVPILEKLDQAGYRVWYDDGIAPGSEWPEYIAEHLNGCSVAIAFISQDSIDSPNCRREITYALSKRKPFLGVILEQTKMSPGMELQLSAQQCIIRHNYRTEEAFLEKLLGSEMLQPCRRAARSETAQAASAAVSHPAPAVSGQAAAPKASQTAEAGTHPAGNNSKKIKPLIWIGAGVLGVVLIALIVSGVLKGRSQADPTSENTSAVAQASTAQTPAETEKSTQNTEPAEADTTAEAETEEVQPTLPPEKEPLKGELEKLMTVTLSSYQNYVIHKSGLIYLDSNGAMGLKSFDGTTDTGALYPVGELYGEYKPYEGKYIIVGKDGSQLEKTAASINRLGLIDARGKEILPEKYAAILNCNEYYAIGIQVSEETKDPKEAVYTTYAEVFTGGTSSDEEVYFKGTWELLSLLSGEPVPGIAGTIADEYENWKYGIGLYGELIELDRGNKIIRGDGSELPAGTELFQNGSYMITEPSKGTVYSTNGAEMFTFDPNEVVIRLSSRGDRFFACKKSGSAYSYTMLDADGQAVSEPLESYSIPVVVGDCIFVTDASSVWNAYDLKGNKLTERSVSYMNSDYDALHGVLKLAAKDEGYLFFDKDGKVLLDLAKGDASVNRFMARKDQLYYNYASGAYEINGSALSSNWWISVRNDGGKYDLVDCFTGTALLRGYERYTVVESPEYGTVVAGLYNQTLDFFVLR